MEPRLATSVLVSSLIRRAESEGGFAAVLAKGDPTAGSLLVILTEKGGKPRLMERILHPDGRYIWQEMAIQSADNAEEFGRILDRRRRFDPDIWLIELDVASAERFAAEMNSER